MVITYHRLIAMAEVAATLVVQLSSLEFDDKVSIYSLMLSRNTQLMASFQAQDTDSAYGDELLVPSYQTI
jgi:hypothetical protein